MKIWVKILPIFLILFLSFPTSVFSRSGCCSSHGGVCGCKCCDGSNLSVKCAPYYPSCNEVIIVPTTKTIYPTNTPRPIAPSTTNKPSPTISITTVEPTQAVTPTEEIISNTPISPTPQVFGTSESKKNSSGNGLETIAFWTVVVYGGYKLIKKLKIKN